MKSDATKQTAHTMATVRNEARTPMADAAASGTPVRMAAAFGRAVQAGRLGFEAGVMAPQAMAVATTPVSGRPFLL